MAPPPALPPDTWLNRYLAVRRPAEVLAWVLLCALQVVANSAVVWIDVRQNGLPFAAWEIITWEVSSNLVWLALVPALLWGLNRKPLHWAVLARHLPWHLLGSVVFCAVHVAGMVALRQMVYAARGRHYEFGPWLDRLFYEGLKDIQSYLVNLALVRVIEPNEAGDARLRLQDGSTVPCSRTHLEALRQRLGAARVAPATTTERIL